jgi:hypothetical protein
MVPADTIARPSPTSVSPSVGPASGGTAITITGTGFRYPAGGGYRYTATAVKVDGTACTSVVVVSDTQITAVTPAHAAGAAELEVVSSGGSGVLAPAFTFYGPATVSSVSPSGGGVAGGTAVTITGASFTGASGATIGGVAVTSFVVVNDTTITCVTGAHAAAAADVVVTGVGGAGTLAGGFTYYAAPTVSGISPSSGDPAGGDAVTITGTNFTGATIATVGGVAITSFQVVNSTTITGVTGAHAVGTVDVAVTNPGGTGTGSALFEYTTSDTPADIFGADLQRWYLETYNATTGVWTDETGTYDTVPIGTGHNPSATTINGHVALSFNGTSQILQAGGNTDIVGSEFTVFGVVTCSDSDQYRVVFGKGAYAGYAWTLAKDWAISADKAVITVDGLDSGSAYSDAAINDGNPHAIVAVCDGVNLAIYVDGPTAEADTGLGSPGTTSDYVTIGGVSPDLSTLDRFWSGKIGNLGIANVAADAGQVTSLMSYLKTWAGIP